MLYQNGLQTEVEQAKFSVICLEFAVQKDVTYVSYFDAELTQRSLMTSEATCISVCTSAPYHSSMVIPRHHA